MAKRNEETKEQTVETTTEQTTNVAPTAEQLAAVATDMNTVLGLNPPIDTALPEADLLAKIVVEAGNIGMGEQGFAQKVWEADKGALAPETLTFLEEQGALKHVTDALAAAEAAKPAAAAPRAAAPAAAAAPAYTRMNAMIDAIKDGGTAAEIIANSDKKLIANGKKAATASIKADIEWLAVILKGTGPITIDANGKITLAK